jgi:hypothetical protein
MLDFACYWNLLLLRAKRPVLEPHLMTVAFPASCCFYMVLGATPEAYLEVEPTMLGDLLFECIGNWHLLSLVIIMRSLPL